MTPQDTYAQIVGENKYWDHLECCWVKYDAAGDETVVPAQLSADEVDTEEVTAVETPL